MNTEIDKELLIRYINDKCSAAEIGKVKQFLQNPEWQRAFEEILNADFLALGNERSDAPDLEEWNQQFRDKYFKKPGAKIWKMQWMRYAAACLALLVAGMYFLYNSSLKHEMASNSSVAMVEKINPKGQRSKVTLPDNSVVYLGAGSSIRFPEHFAANERILTLVGEAFFEISKNPKRPFIIHTGEIETMVLGTSFKITAFENSPLSVSVATGKVRVSHNESGKAVAELAELTPGEGIIWNSQSSMVETIHTDVAEVKRWVNGELTFKKRSIPQIMFELENWYNISIRFDDVEMGDKHYSLSVDGTAPISDALDVICNMTNLKYHFTGKHQVIITRNK